MGRQHGRQLGINTAALDMALASTRSQAISKVLTALGTFAVRHRPKTVSPIFLLLHPVQSVFVHLASRHIEAANQCIATRSSPISSNRKRLSGSIRA
jgi:hypothetical protein